jgi:hypothetical protein
MNLLNWTGADPGVPPYFKSNHYRHGALHILKMSDLKINGSGKMNLKRHPYISEALLANDVSDIPEASEQRLQTFGKLPGGELDPSQSLRLHRIVETRTEHRNTPIRRVGLEHAIPVPKQ